MWLFPAIGRAIGQGASGLVWLVVAPFRGGLYLEDRYEVSKKIRDVLYNDARTAGVIPTASFASGFGLTFGVKAFHDDLLGNEESLSVAGKYGGAVTQSYQLKFEMPELLAGRGYLDTRVRWERKGNLLFQGIGNDASIASGSGLDPRSAEIETRYAEQRLLGVFSAGARFGPATRELRVGASVITNQRDFSSIDASEASTDIADVYDTSALVGFDDFTLTEVTADLDFDWLDDRKKPTRALRLRGFAGGPPADGDFSFFHYGGQVTVEQTLFRPERLLFIRLAHEGVSGKAANLPFSELPRLGGAGLLRGFRKDRYRDKLAAIATAEYHYPIHANIGGALFLEAGKVANDYSELARLGTDWHSGVGGGLFYQSRSGIKARVDLAYGDGVQVYFSTDVLEAFSKRRKEL